MKAFLFILPLTLIACDAKWETQDPAPTPLASPTPVVVLPTPTPLPLPLPTATPESCPYATPTPTPTPMPTPTVITPKQCVNLLSSLSESALKNLRKLIKSGYTTYKFRGKLLTLDINCIDFILYYNGDKDDCK